MTREEEIRGALNLYAPSSWDFRGEIIPMNKDELRISHEGFVRGVKWADTHPNSSWISTKNKLPPKGEEVLAFNKKWINEDFNPKGIRIGFLNGDKEFTSAYWWDYQDSYLTINKSICEDNKDFYVNQTDNTEPEYWMPIPELPKE